MTPDQLKKALTQDIAILDANILRTEDFAHSVGRRFGVYGGESPTDIYDTKRRLRALQVRLLTDAEHAQHLANVRTLDEDGR
jgi:hypothetical protein